MLRRKFGLNIVNARKAKFKVPLAWYSIISTWFFIGKIPGFPGTFGSIASYPLYYYILMNSYSYSDAKHYLLLSVIFLSIIGFFAIKKFQKVTNTYDHSYVVIDEVIGQLLTIYLSFNWIFNIAYALPSFNIPIHTTAFIIALIPFRYFDIRKPLIISYVNHKYKGALGVILDDILAAVFAFAALYVVNLIVSFVV